MAATVALGLTMTGLVFAVAASTIRTLADRSSTMTAIEEATQQLQVSLVTQEAFVFDYALSHRPAALDEYDSATGSAGQAYATFRAEAWAYPNLLVAAEAAHVASNEWREKWAAPFLRSVATMDPGLGASAVAESETLYLPAEKALEALDSLLVVERAATAAQIRDAVPGLATVVVPLGLATTVLLALLGTWLTRSISGPLRRLNRTTEALVAGEDVTFKPERDDEVGALAEVLERLRVDAGQRNNLVAVERDHSETFNQLAELTSFAQDEAELVSAAGRAIRRLVATTGGDILLANPSQNRLTVGVAWGDDARKPGALVTVDRIERCPGIRRSSAFVADDVADDMAVRCLRILRRSAPSHASRCLPSARSSA